LVGYCALHGRLDEGTDLRGAPIKGLSLAWDLCVNRARLHTVAVQTVAKSLRAFVEARISSGDWPLAEATGKPQAAAPRGRSRVKPKTEV
jgi:hypothetical protein